MDLFPYYLTKNHFLKFDLKIDAIIPIPTTKRVLIKDDIIIDSKKAYESNIKLDALKKLLE
jgi:hypothetical protein